MKYICAQPGITYYLWQVEVMVNNFLKMGINPQDIEILIGIKNNVVPKDWVKLQKHYPNIKFFFYNDTREREGQAYPPSIYFHLLKKHFQTYPHLENEVLFLHDSDIVFTQPINFKSLEHGNTWYLSDTNSYINYSYIQQKGDNIYKQMCEIVDIDWRIPKLMNDNSGGAQYIAKNTNSKFWAKVEKDSVDLYKYFRTIEPQFRLDYPNKEPIQKWTAGMWALLWNIWREGHQTKISKHLDFGWANNLYSDVENYGILHNAGVISSNEGCFYKGDYRYELPYEKELNIDPTKASYFYWQQIQETKNNTCFI